MPVSVSVPPTQALYEHVLVCAQLKGCALLSIEQQVVFSV